jgi:hypothetical protein
MGARRGLQELRKSVLKNSKNWSQEGCKSAGIWYSPAFGAGMRPHARALGTLQILD